MRLARGLILKEDCTLSDLLKRAFHTVDDLRIC
jgi:hypothetical protein